MFSGKNIYQQKGLEIDVWREPKTVWCNPTHELLELRLLGKLMLVLIEHHALQSTSQLQDGFGDKRGNQNNIKKEIIMLRQISVHM